MTLVAASLGEAAAASGGDTLIERPLHGHQSKPIVTDTIRRATDRPSIGALGFPFVDNTRLRVENPVHERGISDQVLSVSACYIPCNETTDTNTTVTGNYC